VVFGAGFVVLDGLESALGEALGRLPVKTRVERRG
jgi:hypothetical protein